jgi:prepilin signal peptidase PulO-like enzyme (type II secretory pathway)
VGAPVANEPRPQIRVALGPAARVSAAGIALLVSVGSVWRFGLTADGLIGVYSVCVLVWLSLIDLESHRLPNRILLPGTIVLAVLELAADPGRFPSRLLAASAAFALFLVLALVYRSGLGIGDAKLMLFLGLALGPNVIYALLLGSLAAAAFAVPVLARRGRAARKVVIPLGPFLSVGALIVYLSATGHS